MIVQFWVIDMSFTISFRFLFHTLLKGGKDLTAALGKEIGTGTFGADMKVELLNDGPVTICMDTKNKE